MLIFLNNGLYSSPSISLPSDGDSNHLLKYMQVTQSESYFRINVLRMILKINAVEIQRCKYSLLAQKTSKKIGGEEERWARNCTVSIKRQRKGLAHREMQADWFTWKPITWEGVMK